MGTTNIIHAENQVVSTGSSVNLISGQNRFRFYSLDTLLLDTMLNVEPFIQNSYYMFRPTLDIPIKIVDYHLNGLDTEVPPDSGVVKISLAQFSKTFPGKVNIYVTTETYNINSLQQIQVGQFENVSANFSVYQKITLGKSQLSKQINAFGLIIKDPADQKVLATSSFTLPNVALTGKLLSSVYLLYLDANGKATILMSK